MPVRNRLAEMQPEIAAWRRDFHAHPEILYDTHRTAGLVAERLRGFGCDEVVEGIGRTGVVGVIRGRPGARTIGLRADMDALPIHEATGAAHASTVAGKMHACGHDGHTAMLLGAAQYLAETRNFDGTVVVIFQPAEEGGNGAKAMLDDGLVERFGIDEIYAIHNRPGLPVGQFAIRPGPQLAAADEFAIEVVGKGGHAAEPNLAVDPLVIACQIVVALQTIVSRNADPVAQTVVSVTSVETSSHAFNVISERVAMRGTVRTHSPEMRALAERRIGEIAAATAQALGGRAETTYTHGVPVTINTPENTGFAIAAAEAVAGGCHESPLVMGGEDFSFMLEARPGAFIYVGNGDSAGLHHPAYDFNDETIPAGASWFVEMAERRLRL
ncbi:M20 aminoacylase family protein [Seohaeicola nanhaiensis]|uniref:M20 aminoacylase family protein n=1 Tax=Seohaeicola nanhaiensis TaxID=1387282 RepID=A0ABV9KJ44_9RHOB